MKLRPVLFWCHLAAGVSAGAIILLMSVTGVLLMYERQLIEWSDRSHRSTAGPGRLPVETLLGEFVAQRPELSPSAITVRADETAPATIVAGRTFYVDASSGRILGEPSTGMREAMSALRSWHRWLALEGESRPLGKAISGWANVAFLFVVLSGLYLWIPRRLTWSQIRAVAWFRGGLRGKARDFNWHNAIGFWSAVPLAIVVATAVPISFPWGTTLVYRLAGDTPPAAGAPARGPQRSSPRQRGGADEPRTRATFDGLNALWTRAERQEPAWRSINLRLPEAGAPAVFAIDRGNGGQPQLRSTLTLDSRTGEVVQWEPFAAQTAGRRLRSWARFTHTGEYYGLTGQTIAGIVSGGAVVLVWTGLALAWRRFFRSRSSARTVANSSAGASSEAAA